LAVYLKASNCSESGASGGVKLEAETASIVRMKAKSKNPWEDHPNQEKNQYCTFYWWEKGAFIYTKCKEGSDQKDRIKK